MTRAVLFDLGDVLVHLHLDRGARHFARLIGREHPLIASGAALYLGARAARLGAGEVSPREFLADLGRELGRELSYEEAAAAWTDIFEPWPEMEALAAEVIDAGHRTFLMSNTDPLHYALQAKQMPVLARFTGVHLSYEAGVNKPDPRFFTGALARFGLAAGECLFLDDRPDNVTAARSVGIESLVFDGDPEAARSFLRRGGVNLAP